MSAKEVKPRGPTSEFAPPKGSLAWKIRRFRRLVGLNTDELGERIGISGTSITKIETGQTKISESTMWTIIKIVLELNTDFDEPAIRKHLETWMPRLEEAWNIVEHGPHDFGGLAFENKESPELSLSLVTNRPEVHAGLTDRGKVKDRESEGFNKLLNETREQRRKKQPAKKSGRKRRPPE